MEENQLNEITEKKEKEENKENIENEENEKNKENEENEENEENKENKENKENNDNSSLNKYKEEFKDKEEKEDTENIFKNLAHIILIEGSTPSVYISSLKEIINIGEENNSIEVINSAKFFEFLKNRNFTLSEEEKDQIIKQYGIKIEGEGKYIFEYDKIVDKIFEYMKNDDENLYDEDFLKNIKNMDIEGMD